MKSPGRWIVVFLVVVLPAIPGVQAQGWPQKPLRIIVAATPGIQNDILSRGMVEPLGRALGQPVFVENRVGADGIIGMEACAKAAPDGYTLCSTATNVIIWNPVLRKDLPYDPLRDFAPVIHAGFFDSALVVHPSVPANTVQQLIDLAKAKPDGVTWGHFGVNSTGYMYEEWIKKRRGAPFFTVPYKTQPQLYQALLTGESHAGVGSLINMIPHLKAGKLKALAVTSSKRDDTLPQVPTFEEEGINLPLRGWFGFHYQAGIARELVRRMNQEMFRIINDAGFRTGILDRIGCSPNPGTPEDFDAHIRAQLKAVGEFVNVVGMKPE